MSVYERVVRGTDQKESRRARLESLLAPCEEIYLHLTDPSHDFYQDAHYCLELVCAFMVFHLALLQFAEDEFEMLDYRSRKETLLKFYPVLMESYTEQAVRNHVRAIILNYTNTLNRADQTEEVFNEMSGRTILRLVNDGLHGIWETTPAQMERDRLFYSFPEGHIFMHKPEFMVGRETPLLVRALRYGVALRLEEIYDVYKRRIAI